MIKVEMGQPVMVTDGHGRSLRNWRGTVVKIGRVWIEVKKDGDRPEWAPVRLRLDDRTDGSGYSYGARFYTLDEWAAVERRSEAITFLREQGIDIRHGSLWHNREAELADLIRNAQPDTKENDHEAQ